MGYAKRVLLEDVVEGEDVVGVKEDDDAESGPSLVAVSSRQMMGGPGVVPARRALFARGKKDSDSLEQDSVAMKGDEEDTESLERDYVAVKQDLVEATEDNSQLSRLLREAEAKIALLSAAPRVSSVVSVAPGASSRTGRNFHEGSSPSQSEMPQRVWSSRPVALSPSPVTPSFRGGTVGSGSDFFGTKDNRMELQLMFGTSLRAQDTRTIGGRAATADALLEYEEWCDGKELSPRDRLKGFELLGQWNDKEGCPRIRDLIRGMKSDAVDEGGPPPGWIDVLTEFRLLCAIVQSSDAAVDAAKAIVQGDAVHVCAYLEVKIMAFRQARPHNWSQAKVVQSLLNGMNSDCKGIFKARHHAAEFLSGRELHLFAIKLEGRGDLPSLPVVLAPSALSKSAAPARVISVAAAVVASTAVACTKFSALSEREKSWYKSSAFPGEERSEFMKRMDQTWGMGNCFGCGSAEHQRASCPVQRAAFEERQRARELRAGAVAAGTVAVVP